MSLERMLNGPPEPPVVMEKQHFDDKSPAGYWDNLDHPNKSDLLTGLAFISVYSPGSVSLERLSSVLDQAIVQGTLPDHTDWDAIQTALHAKLTGQ